MYKFCCYMCHQSCNSGAVVIMKGWACRMPVRTHVPQCRRTGSNEGRSSPRPNMIGDLLITSIQYRGSQSEDSLPPTFYFRSSVNHRGTCCLNMLFVGSFCPRTCSIIFTELHSVLSRLCLSENYRS